MKQELKDFIDKVNMVKIPIEIENMKVAAKFVKWTYNNIVNEIEDIIEVERQVKHETISKKVENMLEDQKKLDKFLNANPGVDKNFIEYPLPVLVQSGENFTINKLNVQSDSNKLNHETIYLNVSGKYKDMNVMAARTLIVNPQDDQKKAYNIAFEALDVAIKNLVVG